MAYMACGAFLQRDGAVRIHFGAGAVETGTIGPPADQHVRPRQVEQRVKHALRSPATHPGVYRASFAEAFRQGAPLAAVLHDMEHRVNVCGIRDPHISALNRYAVTIMACRSILCPPCQALGMSQMESRS